MILWYLSKETKTYRYEAALKILNFTILCLWYKISEDITTESISLECMQPQLSQKVQLLSASIITGYWGLLFVYLSCTCLSGLPPSILAPHTMYFRLHFYVFQDTSFQISVPLTFLFAIVLKISLHPLKHIEAASSSRNGHTSFC
jgi:hypothetical protein